MKKIVFVFLILTAMMMSCSQGTPSNFKDKGNVHLVVSISIKPEHRDELMKSFDKMVAETRKEKGCIAYYLTECEDKLNDFVLIEEWATQADLDAHSASKHFAEYKKEVDGKFESSSLQRTKLVY